MRKVGETSSPPLNGKPGKDKHIGDCQSFLTNISSIKILHVQSTQRLHAQLDRENPQCQALISWHDCVSGNPSQFQVYVGIFSIFVSIVGRAKLPAVKFWWSTDFPWLCICKWKFLFNDSQLLIPSSFHLMLKEFVIDWVTWSIVTVLYTCFMVMLLWFLLMFLWFEYNKFLWLNSSSSGYWKLDVHSRPLDFLIEVFLLLTLITTYCLKLN